MTATSPTSKSRCADCGATLSAGASVCWLCHAPTSAGGTTNDSMATKAQRPLARFASPSESSAGFSLASLMIFVTLACVVLGVSTIAPGIGIPLGIVLLVVWLRTVAVARQRAARGLAVTRSERVQLFLSSFSTTLTLLAVTCVAGCAAFVVACFACVGTLVGLQPIVNSETSLLFGWVAFGLVVLAIAVATLWWLARVIRRRWRRDIGEGP